MASTKMSYEQSPYTDIDKAMENLRKKLYVGGNNEVKVALVGKFPHFHKPIVYKKDIRFLTLGRTIIDFGIAVGFNNRKDMASVLIHNCCRLENYSIITNLASGEMVLNSRNLTEFLENKNVNLKKVFYELYNLASATIEARSLFIAASNVFTDLDSKYVKGMSMKIYKLFAERIKNSHYGVQRIGELTEYPLGEDIIVSYFSDNGRFNKRTLDSYINKQFKSLKNKSSYIPMEALNFNDELAL